MVKRGQEMLLCALVGWSGQAFVERPVRMNLAQEVSNFLFSG
jgi:hypothetical protein